MLSRRTLLGTGTAAGIGAIAESRQADAAPAIRRHVVLGKTGLEVSEIGIRLRKLAGCRSRSPCAGSRRDVLRHRGKLSLRLVGRGDGRGAARSSRQDHPFLQNQGGRIRQRSRHDGRTRGQPQTSADRLCRYLLQSCRQQRRPHAKRGLGAFHRAGEEARQDPLSRHVRPW